MTVRYRSRIKKVFTCALAFDKQFPVKLYSFTGSQTGRAVVVVAVVFGLDVGLVILVEVV